MPGLLPTDQSRNRILRYADVEFDLGRLKVRRNGRFVRLSTMQMRLLRHFLENPEVVFSRKELLEAVWSGEGLTEGAVTACVVRMRSALDSAGEPSLIRSIQGVGYALDADADAEPSPGASRSKSRGGGSQSRHRGETALS